MGLSASLHPLLHDFNFPPESMMLYGQCEKDHRIEHLYSAFTDQWTALVPLGSWVMSAKFGWVRDRSVVSWQLKLSEEGIARRWRSTGACTRLSMQVGVVQESGASSFGSVTTA